MILEILLWFELDFEDDNGRSQDNGGADKLRFLLFLDLVVGIGGSVISSCLTGGGSFTNSGKVRRVSGSFSRSEFGGKPSRMNSGRVRRASGSLTRG